MQPDQLSRAPIQLRARNDSPTGQASSSGIAQKIKEGKNSVMDGVPASLPSIVKATRIQEKAKQVGFEWRNKEDVWKKV